MCVDVQTARPLIIIAVLHMMMEVARHLLVTVNFF